MDRKHRLSSSKQLLLTLLVAAVVLTFNHSRQTFLSDDHDASQRRILKRNPDKHLQPDTAILLPDWEVLIVLPSSYRRHHRRDQFSCFFQNNATSPAVFSGPLLSSLRPTFTCFLPDSVRRLRPFYSPILINSGDPPELSLHRRRQMLRWNFLVYEATSTPDDVILFVKGVNSRQFGRRDTSELRCVFGSGAGNVTSAVTSASQEVVRCLHPDLRPGTDLPITLEFVGKGVIPSVARYAGKPPAPAAQFKRKALTCACTMVRDVAKFLPEWVAYHSAVGVEKFFLYDNGSDDGLETVVDELGKEEFDVSVVNWPWPKTQEAGFSHCAATRRDVCEWMLFIDVDEFVFAPRWGRRVSPSVDMIARVVEKKDKTIGQIMIHCRDFGPSGWDVNPPLGVTQGYTCRRAKIERHKSIVRLDSVNHSLANVVHHFDMREGFKVEKLAVSDVVVNHYKYQAWPEFKQKFRRRVSTYVPDWKNTINLGSKDRAPGLGSEDIEPVDWTTRFCNVNDTQLKNTMRKWFNPTQQNGQHRMAWTNLRQSTIASSE